MSIIKFLEKLYVVIIFVFVVSCTYFELNTRHIPDPVRHASLKRRELHKIAEEDGVKIGDDVKLFFDAAEVGDFNMLTNYYFRFLKEREVMKGFNNRLWPIIEETYGFYCIWHKCFKKDRFMREYACRVLEEIPSSSIFFGGTPWGRFVISAYNDMLYRGKIIAITQNQLYDYVYIMYIRWKYGDRCWVPSKSDFISAVERYCAEVDTGLRKREGEIYVVGQQYVIKGQASSMAICEIVARDIHQNNIKLPMFVEESFIIEWMYPYLEPYGLIMKLNSTPVQYLSHKIITSNEKYWDNLMKRLFADSEWVECEEARDEYAKMRSAIGGLYFYRNMDVMAEKAFKEAIEIYPLCWQANIRLVELYKKQGRIEEAIDILKKYRNSYVKRKKINNAVLKTIDSMVEALEKRK